MSLPYVEHRWGVLLVPRGVDHAYFVSHTAAEIEYVNAPRGLSVPRLLFKTRAPARAWAKAQQAALEANGGYPGWRLQVVRVLESVEIAP